MGNVPLSSVSKRLTDLDHEFCDEVTRWSLGNVADSIRRWQSAVHVPSNAALAEAISQGGSEHDARAMAIPGRDRSRGDYLKRRQYWEVFTDYAVICKGAFLSLPMKLFETMAPDPVHHDICALELFTLLLLWCDGALEDRMTLMYWLYTGDRLSKPRLIDQPILADMLRSIYSVCFKLGVTDVIPDAAYQTALSVESIELADTNRDSLLRKDEFIPWAVNSIRSQRLLLPFMSSNAKGKRKVSVAEMPVGGAAKGQRKRVPSDKEPITKHADEDLLKAKRAALRSRTRERKGSDVSVSSGRRRRRSLPSEHDSRRVGKQHGDAEDVVRRAKLMLEPGAMGLPKDGAGPADALPAAATASSEREGHASPPRAAVSDRQRRASILSDAGGAEINLVFAEDVSPTRPGPSSMGSTVPEGSEAAAERTRVREKRGAGSGGNQRRRSLGFTLVEDASDVVSEAQRPKHGSKSPTKARRRSRSKSKSRVRERRNSAVRPSSAPPADAEQLERLDKELLGDTEVPAHLRVQVKRTRAAKLRTIATRKTLDDLLRRSKFSRKELFALADEFVSRSSVVGRCDRAQFQDILRRYLPHLAREVALQDRIFKVFDANDDGEIDYREFVTGLSMIMRGTLYEKLELVFLIHDADGDGSMDILELIHMIRRGIGDVRDVVAFADEILDALDADRNGTVDRDEFVTALKRDPVLLRQFTASVSISLNAGRALHELRNVLPTFSVDRLDRMISTVKKEDAGMLNRALDFDGFVAFMKRHFDARATEMPALERVFEAMNDTNSGVMPVREMLHGFAQVLTVTPEDHAAFIFGAYDADNSGTLSHAELTTFIMETQAKHSRSAALILRTLHRLDKNNDGVISLDEFVARASRDELLMRALETIFDVRAEFKVSVQTDSKTQALRQQERIQDQKAKLERIEERKRERKERIRSRRIALGEDEPGATSRKVKLPSARSPRPPAEQAAPVKGRPQRGVSAAKLPQLNGESPARRRADSTERHTSQDEWKTMSFVLSERYRAQMEKSLRPQYDPSTDSLRHKDGTSMIKREGSFRHTHGNTNSRAKSRSSPRAATATSTARLTVAASPVRTAAPLRQSTRTTSEGSTVGGTLTGLGSATSHAVHDLFFAQSRRGRAAVQHPTPRSVRMVDAEKGLAALDRTVGPERWTQRTRRVEVRKSPRAAPYLRAVPPKSSSGRSAQRPKYLGRREVEVDVVGRQLPAERSSKEGVVIHHPDAASHGLLSTTATIDAAKRGDLTRPAEQVQRPPGATGRVVAGNRGGVPSGYHHWVSGLPIMSPVR